MSVTNYIPGTCKYTFDKLKKVVYLVSASHLKDVHIDDGNAYIEGLTELPLRINGFNIQFTEESSLDERYKFTKTVTLSMHGYVNHKAFDGKYYVILETEDGNYWMVNIDFPSVVTYTFNLNAQQYQTDFTFKSQSNFPTLRLISQFQAVEPLCLLYNTPGISSLKLVEKEYAAIDTENKRVYTYGKTFQVIDFLGDTCIFTETYDGQRVTNTIEFSIGMGAYKSSWHYNLLEFTKNLYSAELLPKRGDNAFYVGFNFGLQPSFSVKTTSEMGESDLITITLTEMSEYGSTAAVDWTDEHSTETMWLYVKYVDTIPCYECISFGVAKYLVQEEVIGDGVRTGRYKVLEGYESQFPTLNIIGTFSEEETFMEESCNTGECNITTNLPNTITYSGITCNTYSVRSSCPWSVTNLPSYITVSPTSGDADTDYQLEVCNTQSVTGATYGSFRLVSGNVVRVVNVNLQPASNCITPQTQSINCLAQNVTFAYNGNCQLNITQINPSLTYSIGYNTLTVNVPKNTASSARTWTISATNCDCSSEILNISINQDKMYSVWADVSGDFMCINGDSYTRQEHYTGTTSSNLVPTGEYRQGTLIQTGDTRCQTSITRWVFDGHYYCIDGDKTQCIEQEISYDDGTTWQKTGLTRLGDIVESESSWCETDPTYDWLQSTQWQCGT